MRRRISRWLTAEPRCCRMIVPTSSLHDPAVRRSADMKLTAPQSDHEDRAESWLNGSRRLAFDLVLLWLCALGALAVAGLLGPARPFVVLVAALSVPGGAVLTRLNVDNTLTAVAITIGLSLGLDIAGSLALVWSTYWHPVVLAHLLGAGSAILLVWDILRLSRDHDVAPE